ncbi:MAG: type I DNA topoisomerase [Acholeplasmataceae bacterium]|nr:type I DNA topoisomerase [Acholeplasmataceae bacterium]
MEKKLVIVESPAKSTTIEKYLGPDYVVASSKGHIRDLTTRGYGGFGVDIENNFQPMYKNLRDKASVVKELKKLVKEASKVYLATDPDREGEAISWHLYEVLGLKNKDYERIVFHEITKPAVLQALENGRQIDIDLVRSQESRRILDRIIGFSLSKLLQKKIGSKSAGRVQSVALKLIVDREKEIMAFIPEEYWEVFCEFTKERRKIKAKLVSRGEEKLKLNNQEETEAVLNSLTSDYVIQDIIKKNRNKSAKPPFITSTLQQEASSRYNFMAKKTMMIAQRLYEGIELANERVGLITYMRTDSFRLSDQFIAEGKEFISAKYGMKYFNGYRKYVSKAKNIQDAHEAIRPSSLKHTPESVRSYLSNDEYRLYSLIYYRALASLMTDALVEDQKLKIENNGYIFEAGGVRVLFDGYLQVYGEYEADEEKALPEFTPGEIIKDVNITSEQKFTSPPMRYSEARLIKKMEELGIGRPSTYSITMETLKQRYYVRVDKKTFIPTEQGILTSEKLDQYFSNVINVKYTAEMEEILDDISEGEKIWYEELKRFYNTFMPLVNYANEHMEKTYPIFVEENCPECGSPLVKRNGRFGQFIACSAFPKCHYIKKEEKEEDLTDVTCPKCGIGHLVERVSHKGRSRGKKFYACNRYPECKTTFSELPEN